MWCLSGGDDELLGLARASAARAAAHKLVQAAQEYEIWRLPNSTAAFALEPTHLAAFSQVHKRA